MNCSARLEAAGAPGPLPSRVYPVVDSARWIGRLVGSGARLVQLRIKQPDAALLRREVRAAREICVTAGAVLVLNDHWRLAIAEQVDFVHLGQEDLDQADREAIRSAGIRLGISTHSEAELARALEVKPDYIALGPVYPTTLKQMPWAPQGLRRLAEWKACLGGLPLVAIGGITLERAPGCIEAGADCVAAVSDIVAAASPEERLRQWLARLDADAAPASGG